MKDQAEKLREIVSNLKKGRDVNPLYDNRGGARIIAVTSGKGGVGKTNFTINLAISLRKKGLRVLIIDADFGLSNVDIMLGVTPRYDLSHVIFHNKDLNAVITEGPAGIMVISGGSGVIQLINMGTKELDTLINKLGDLDYIADIILIDTGAGISSNTLKMILAANDIVLITTPEPTSLMDAYSVVKIVSSAIKTSRLSLVVNKAENTKEAEQIMGNFLYASKRFLNVEISKLGFIEYNNIISKCVRKQSPFLLEYPKSIASRQIDNMAEYFIETAPYDDASQKGIAMYIKRMVAFFNK